MSFTQTAKDMAVKYLPTLIENSQPQIATALEKAFSTMTPDQKTLFLKNWNMLNDTVQKQATVAPAPVTSPTVAPTPTPTSTAGRKKRMTKKVRRNRRY